MWVRFWPTQPLRPWVRFRGAIFPKNDTRPKAADTVAMTRLWPMATRREGVWHSDAGCMWEG